VDFYGTPVWMNGPVAKAMQEYGLLKKPDAHLHTALFMRSFRL
jgi:hypothetical protein